MNTLKDLLCFDEYPDDEYINKGGYAAIARVAAPIALNVLKKNTGKKPILKSGSKNNLNSEDEKKLSSEMLDFWNQILEIAKDNFKRVYNIFIGWVLTPIIFGSFAPALPFFLVMGVLYGIFNYLQKLIIKL